MEETIKLEITAEDVTVLNDIVTNTIPTLTFGKVAQFVAKINTQLQEQTKKEEGAN